LSLLSDSLDRLLEAAAILRRERRLAGIVRTAERGIARAFMAQGREFLRRLAAKRGLFGAAEALREGVGEDLDWEPLFTAAELDTLGAFETPIERATEAALLAGARVAIADLGIETSFGLKNPRAEAFLKDRAAARVTMINDATRAEMRTLLTKAMEEGWGYDKTARTLREQFDGFAGRMPQKHIQSRAHLVAVQETGEAYEEGNIAVGRELEDAGLAMEKSWLTVGDDRVSEQCLLDQGAGWIGLDEMFPSGNDRPPGHVACRCTTLIQRAKGKTPANKPVAPVGVEPPPPINDIARQVDAIRHDPTIASARERAAKIGDVIEAEVERRRIAITQASEPLQIAADKANANYFSAKDKYRIKLKTVDVDTPAGALFVAQQEERIAQLAKAAQDANAAVLRAVRPAEHDRMITAVLREVRTMGGRLDCVAATGVSPALKAGVQAIADTYPRAWLEMSAGPQRLHIELLDKRRAFCDNKYGIHVAEDTIDTTTLHELGHYFEDVVPGLHDAIVEFYDYRTKRSGLTAMGKGYEDWEKTRRDKFVDKYMGKEYMQGSNRYATEILSMGMEFLFGVPNQQRRLWTKDPEYAKFVLGLLAGV